jgi:uncharacterized protein
MSRDRRIDYIEFPSTGIAATKEFYIAVFGWEFVDYGPEYTSFGDGRISGGFTSALSPVSGGPLVVIFVDDLLAAEERVRDAGGTITKEIFSFPGGSRFHFRDPSGNELAVWREDAS